MVGFVSLVGAGPWDPELLTLAGRDRLARADAVVADYLVNPALMMHCRPDVQLHQRATGPHADMRIDQDEINRLLVALAKAGNYVVRLKGGDPCMFGRGGEEAQYLRKHGIAFEFVPGVSSTIAAPESAGIPVTHRDFTPAVTFVSGYEAYEKAGLQVAWEHLAKSAGTIVLMMSMRHAKDNAERLIAAGRDPETPSAVIRWGTRGIQKTLVAPLREIADVIAAAGLRPPAVMVIGEVVRLRQEIAWFESLPLFGKRVVVTRSLRQSGELLHMLAAQGADPVAFPCLELRPPEDLERLHRALRELDRHDGILLSSPNGVQAMFAGLLATGRDLRALHGRLIAAVGTGTAEALRAQGIVADLLPDTANSEGLIELLRGRDLLGQSWLHLRAAEGRELLGQAIASAGGHYELVAAYRTVKPVVSELLVRSLRSPEAKGEGCDAICFASGKAARHFLETLRSSLGPEASDDVLCSSKIVSIGPVTTEALQALGLAVSVTAEVASDTGLLQAVLRAFA